MKGNFQALFFRFTIRSATPMNSNESTPRHVPILDNVEDNQIQWADREMLYLQRGPLLAMDKRY